MKLKLNKHGVFGLLVIILMIFIASVKNWNIPWGYFVLSITLYSPLIIFFNLWIEELQAKRKDLLFVIQSHKAKNDQTEKILIPQTLLRDDFLDKKKLNDIELDISGIYEAKETIDRSYFDIFRIVSGIHMTFMFLALGLGLNFEDGIIYGGLFVACIFAGCSIPFLLFARER